MSDDTTNALFPFLDAELSIAAALDACGSSPERIREWVLACRRSARRALDSHLQRALALRGYDAGELCASELTATLTDVTVCDLLQTISMGRKDAVIEVVHAGQTSRIWCADGKIVDAESGRLTGELAFHRIWGLDAGELCADFRPVRRARSIQSSTPGLMLEAARRKDECAMLRNQLGGPDLIYSAVSRATSAQAGASSVESALLEAFNPSASIDDVLANGALGDLELLQALCSLQLRGCLVPSRELPDPAPPAPTKACESGLRVAWLRARARALRLSAAWRVLLPALGLGLAVVLVFAVRHRSEPQGATRSLAEIKVESALPDPATISAPTFPVQVTAEPAQAALWLDGERIATGVLSIVLVRDGRTHELRIDAPEHRPQTLLFRDLSPPRRITLQRVRAAEGAQPPARRRRQASRSEARRRRQAWGQLASLPMYSEP